MKPTKNTEIAIPNGEVAKLLNESVANVLSNKQIIGFERAYIVASAIEQLKSLLTGEYMKPIMAMQGNRLGFKTDKDLDKNGNPGTGYPEATVKNCLIEAVLMGLQPTGNQFNIIAGNTYATKEGVGELLKSIDGLTYKLNFELPRINADKSSAAVSVLITWNLNGTESSETIQIPVKMNAYMGTDAVLGKATRKARKWLYDTITGSELPEADVEDIAYTDVTNKIEQGNSKKEQLKQVKAETREKPKTAEPNLNSDLENKCKLCEQGYKVNSASGTHHVFENESVACLNLVSKDTSLFNTEPKPEITAEIKTGSDLFGGAAKMP